MALDECEQEIIDLVSDGVGYRTIALQYGVSVSTMFEWVNAISERSTRFAAAMELASVAEDQAALDAILTAQTPFELNKAREEAIHRRWRAKALAPKRYGDRQQVDLTAKVEIDIEQVDKKLERLLSKAK